MRVVEHLEVRGQILLLNHRLETGQLLRSYECYRLHLWHASVFHVATSKHHALVKLKVLNYPHEIPLHASKDEVCNLHNF